jgi:hypothetical protein
VATDDLAVLLVVAWFELVAIHEREVAGSQEVAGRTPVDNIPTGLYPVSMQSVPTSRNIERSGAVAAAYRRLALTILALDVASLAQQLSSAPKLNQQAA